MIRGPGDTDRTIVIGETGSGKSQFAIALLATRNWDKIPWFIIDYKGEDLIEDIMLACGDKITSVGVDCDPPKKPGLYYVKVRPLLDDGAIELFLQKIYHRASNQRQGSGIFLDEGYALPRNSKFFDILLTQGRSLKCPIICLYQRPVHMTRFATTQSTFRAIFRVGDKRDKETIASYIPPAKMNDGRKITVFNDLPPFHCFWYDVAKGVTSILTPGPPRGQIIQTFIDRLAVHKTKRAI